MPLRGPAWATGPTTGGLPLPLWKTAPLRSDGPLRGRGRPLPTAGPSAIDGVLHQEGQSFTNGPAGHQGPTRTHTHIHTHAHKYTYKYIDIHIHRQTECRGAPVRCGLLQSPFPAYFSMRLPHIHNTPQDRLLQSPHNPTRTHTRTHILSLIHI